MTDDTAEIEAARENAYLSGVRDGRKLERERIAAAIEADGSDAAYWEEMALRPSDRDRWASEAKAYRKAAAIARTEPS